MNIHSVINNYLNAAKRPGPAVRAFLRVTLRLAAAGAGIGSGTYSPFAAAAGGAPACGGKARRPRLHEPPAGLSRHQLQFRQLLIDKRNFFLS